MSLTFFKAIVVDWGRPSSKLGVNTRLQRLDIKGSRGTRYQAANRSKVVHDHRAGQARANYFTSELI
jgi:hypothetical protein